MPNGRYYSLEINGAIKKFKNHKLRVFLVDLISLRENMVRNAFKIGVGMLSNLVGMLQID